MNIYRFFILIFILLLVGCDLPDGEVYMPTNQDKSPDLIEKSDLIAIVNISGGADQFGKEVFVKIGDFVSAKIIEIYWSSRKMENIPIRIEISSRPYVNREGGSISRMALRNGENLVFLRKINGEAYVPITASSIMGIFNSGNVLPIWKQPIDGDGLSRGYPLSEVKDEILKAIKSAGRSED